MRKPGIFLLLTLPILYFSPGLVWADDAADSQNFCSDLNSRYPQIATSSTAVTDILTNDTCVTGATNADQCCNNPGSCAMGQTGSSTGAQIVQVLSGAAMQAAGAACSRLSSLSDVSGEINSALSQRCTYYINQCSGSCKSKVQQVTSDIQTAVASKCSSAAVTRLSALLQAYQNSQASCGQASSGNFSMVQQATAANMGKKFSSMCQGGGTVMAAASTNAQAEGGDSSPSSGVAPSAQMRANEGSAATDSASSGASGSPTQSTAIDKAADKKSLSGTMATEPGSDQTAPTGGGNAGSQSPSQKAAGAASGAPGNSPLVSGLSTETSGEHGGKGGYDTTILKSVAGKTGLSNSSATMMSGTAQSGPGGGWTAPALGKMPFATDNFWGHKFSLKDFLPGGKYGEPKPEPFRGIASIGLPANPDVSPAHDDIFDKITNRFFQVCLRQGLYDCETLKKVKGN